MDVEPLMELAQAWGLPDGAATQQAVSRVAAVRWRHTLPAFPEATLPSNALVCLLAPAASTLHRGGRRLDASAHRHGMGLLPTGTYGAWTFDAPIDVLHLYVPDGLLAEVAGGGRAPGLDERLVLEDPLLLALMLEVSAAMAQGDGAGLYVDALGLTAAHRLVRAYSDAAPPPLPAKGGLAPWQVRKLTDYLIANLDQDVSLGDLAGLLGLSAFHVCRAFRQSTGLPPHRWQQARRVERAADLLRSTNLPLDAVAAAVGYGGTAQLSVPFRKAMGCTPGQYRRQSRG